MMMVDPDLTMLPSVAVDWPAQCGEGPVWDVDSGTVLWVDILRGQIHRTDPRTMITRSWTLPTLVGAAALRQHGGFVAATTEGFCALDDDGSWDRRLPVLPAGSRMNDAKCDPAGRFVAGSTDRDFAAGAGALWILDPDWQARRVLDGLTLPNGLGWSPDGSVLYLIDSIERLVHAIDYDLEHGELGVDRTLISFPDEIGGLPDGLCVDAEGNLWIAIWDAAKIITVSAAGDRLRTIPLPVRRPTSCAFIGSELDQLWITTARDGLDLGDSDRPDGSIFAVRPGVRGLPTPRFAG